MKIRIYLLLSSIALFSSSVSVAVVPADESGSFTLGVDIGNQPNVPTLVISGTLHNGSNTSLPYQDVNGGGSIPSTDLGSLKFEGSDLEQGASCKATFSSVNANGYTYRLLKKDASGALDNTDTINYILRAAGSTTKINTDGTAGLTSFTNTHVHSGKIFTAYSPADSSNKYNCEINITALSASAISISGKQGVYEDTVNYTVTVQ